MTFGTPLEVAPKSSRSATGGDTIDNEYKITIPFVQPDMYSGTPEYIATTLQVARTCPRPDGGRLTSA